MDFDALFAYLDPITIRPSRRVVDDMDMSMSQREIR